MLGKLLNHEYKIENNNKLFFTFQHYDEYKTVIKNYFI